jgi:tetratricopeptide (TPR) repeat protein
MTRPSLGGIQPNFPGIATKPAPLPGFGSNLRPMPGRPKPDGPGFNTRPVIGGYRPNLGGDTNINIGQLGNNHISRPSWDIDPGFSRPSWGLDHNWHHHWHHNGVHHHHHGWYNGCWHGHWGSDWYAPIFWGAIGWGLGGYSSSWGSGPYYYYNPYYAAPTIAQNSPYDYSQPVVINNNVAVNDVDRGGDQTASDPREKQGLERFDSALAAFKKGSYAQALLELNAALKLLPNDPVVHEVRSLALFATADYNAAAAGLASLLASAPGMDWTTMSGLYGDIDDYTSQLRKLERYTQQNPQDAASHFVLAYHYLVTDSKDEAVAALKIVVKNQPKDVTAKRMLDALVPPTSPTTETTATPAPVKTARITPAPATPAESDVTTDLVGSWKAEAGNATIELTITDDSQFTWKATGSGQAPTTLSGNLAGDAESIELITANNGTMGGTVVSKGPDSWVLLIANAPKTDPGIAFTRVK